MPTNFNQEYLVCHCHISKFDSDFFLRERGFINPSPTRRPIAKNQRNSLTYLIHRNHLISTPSPSYLSILNDLPVCVLISHTSLNSTLVPTIYRDLTNRIPTAFLDSHPYLIIWVNPTLIPNALSQFSN